MTVLRAGGTEDSTFPEQPDGSQFSCVWARVAGRAEEEEDVAVISKTEPRRA